MHKFKHILNKYLSKNLNICVCVCVGRGDVLYVGLSYSKSRIWKTMRYKDNYKFRLKKPLVPGEEFYRPSNIISK